MAQRKRYIIDGEARPALRPYVRLSFNKLRRAWVVLAPEHIYWPDETSLSILQKCDGERSCATMIDELAQDYDAPPEVISADVLPVLQDWADLQLLRDGKHCV